MGKWPQWVLMKKNSEKFGLEEILFLTLGILVACLGVFKFFQFRSSFLKKNKKNMELYFLRHGIAVEAEEFKGSDAERPLTLEARRKMIEEIQGMKALGVSFDALISSPWLRAKQTAELVKKHLPFEKDLEIEPLLIPGSPFEKLLKKLSDRAIKSAMLVGHEPSLSFWIQSLLEMEQSLRLKKGGLCHLSLAGREGAELLALWTPKSLRLKK